MCVGIVLKIDSILGPLTSTNRQRVTDFRLQTLRHAVKDPSATSECCKINRPEGYDLKLLCSHMFLIA